VSPRGPTGTIAPAQQIVVLVRGLP
jgi:hypothetical protein